MELNLKTTPVYKRNAEALQDKSVRFVVNQGGRGSSKTWSILQLIMVYALSNKNKTISIIRKSLATLRSTAMEDFLQILRDASLYRDDQWSVSEFTYFFSNGSRVRFIGADDSEKLKGKKNDVLYLNEANALTYQDFTQLNLRCEEKLFIDYNPNDNYSWVYTLIEHAKTRFIKSTYRDNPFLNASIIEQIEDFRTADPDMYRIYGQGEQAHAKETIYTHYEEGFYVATGGTVYTAIDPGYTHPTAVVQVNFVGRTCYARELVYASGLINNDIVTEMERLFIPGRSLIVDSARPDLIEELRRAGFQARQASKAVKEGILAVKSYNLVIDPSSKNLLKELRNYKWVTDSADRPTDKPVKIHDDAVDALRYAVYAHYLKTNNRSQRNFGFSLVDI